MTAVLDRARRPRPSASSSPLVAEVEHVRALLEAFARRRAAAGRRREPDADGVRAGRSTGWRALLGLSPFERRLLLLAAAVELDGEVAALVAALQDGGEPRPTFGLALAALPGAHWDALAPGSPLRCWRLRRARARARRSRRRPLRIDERILHHLTGIDAPRRAPRRRAPARAGRAARLARRSSGSPTSSRGTVAAAGARAAVRLDGDDADARLGVAQALAAGARPRRARRPRRRAAAAGARARGARAAASTARRCCATALPVVDAADAHDAAVAALARRARRAGRRCVVGEAARTHRRPRRACTASSQLPTPAEARALWTAALGEPVARELAEPVEEVAQHFRLERGGDRRRARASSRRLRDGRRRRAELCAGSAASVRASGSTASPSGSSRRRPGTTSSCPTGHLELLHEIVRHVRHRTQVYERWGFGARTTPRARRDRALRGRERHRQDARGRGARRRARARPLPDRPRGDASASTSARPRRTCAALFDAAEASGAVLLFDEADALFGKRGEVKDGHDRYANLEVAYLLQRMESYRGLAILTTNLRANVDRAFLRRLRFVVQFPFPDAAQRAEIWRRMFPPAAPLDGIDARRARAARRVSGGVDPRRSRSRRRSPPPRTGPAVTPAHVLRAARGRVRQGRAAAHRLRGGGAAMTRRIEIVVDELVVRGLSPEAARAAAAALEARLADAGRQSGAERPRARARHFRRLPAIDAARGSPAELGDAVAGAVWGALAGGGATVSSTRTHAGAAAEAGGRPRPVSKPRRPPRARGRPRRRRRRARRQRRRLVVLGRARVGARSGPARRRSIKDRRPTRRRRRRR